MTSCEYFTLSPAGVLKSKKIRPISPSDIGHLNDGLVSQADVPPPKSIGLTAQSVVCAICKVTPAHGPGKITPVTPWRLQ